MEQLLADPSRLAGISEAASESFDLRTLANELGRPIQLLDEQLERHEATGLLLRPTDPGHPPLLLRAGRQYLASGGNVGDDVLTFLPHTIDDLVARRALLTAGTILVDEFRAALLHRLVVEHARELVPPAFAEALNRRGDLRSRPH